MADILRAFTLQKVTPGKIVYVSDERQKRTYSATITSNGSLSQIKLFANQGGESIATDSNGNVYIAAGQIYIFHSDGTPAGEIDVPERPTSIAFGGKDGRTLFILARTSLYSASALETSK
jgi:sugar lactone lactonase YvrE